jgi:hypothetical protein
MVMMMKMCLSVILMGLDMIPGLISVAVDIVTDQNPLYRPMGSS